MKNILITLLAIIATGNTFAQNISRMEYWVDTEPGVGNAININGLPTSPDVSNFSFPVPALSTGFHIIGIRSMDASGKWSHTNFHSLYVSDTAVYNLDRLEYYWGNTDPGFGNASDTTFSVVTTDINNGNFVLQNPPVPGTYTLFIRSLDVLGRWSHTNYVQGIDITSCSNFTISISNGTINICQGQSIDVSASNANAYTWSPSAGLSSTTGASVSVSPTLNTTYSVTGVNGACSNTQTVAVTVNANPSVSASANNTSICNGASTSLTANGADTYQWSNSLGNNAIVNVSPTVSTTYTVIGTNAANCSATDTVLVTVNQNPVVTISTNQDSICSGENSSLTASGANTYQWNNGLGTNVTVTPTPANTTTYVVNGTDGNSCTGTASQVITVIPVPETPIVQVNGIVNLSSSISGTSYQWYLNGSPISGATNQNFTAVSNGLYSVVVFNEFGCESATSAEVNVVIDGIEQIGSLQAITVYPNPNNGIFFIRSTAIQVGDLLVITDVLGREVLREEYPFTSEKNIQSLASGMYHLSVNRNGVVYFDTKLIKQ